MTYRELLKEDAEFRAQKTTPKLEMTVSELIEELKNYPGDSVVIVHDGKGDTGEAYYTDIDDEGKVMIG
jgi:hypothetical protein